MKNIIQNGAIICVALIVALALAEGVVRARQFVKYGTVSHSVYEFKNEKKSGLRVPVPGMKRGNIEINSMGFRSPELTLPKPTGTVRLAFLGGSTTFCAEVSGNDMTWPHLVWKTVDEKYPGASIDYVNAGVSGLNSGNSLTNLQDRVAPLEPDVIIIYHGINDVANDASKRAAQAGVRGNVGDDRLRNWWMNYSLLAYLVGKNVELSTRKRELLNPEGKLNVPANEYSDAFRTRLTTLIKQAQAVAPLVVVATMSYHQRASQSPEEQAKAGGSAAYFMPYLSLSGLLDAYGEYNRIVREVAKATGALLVEGEEDIPGTNDFFHDAVHFSDKGSARMARRVSEVLLSSARGVAVLQPTP